MTLRYCWRRTVFGLALVAAAAAPAPAQTPQPAPSTPPSATPPSGPAALTLDSVVDEALRTRPLLQLASERVEAAQARVSQAQAGLRPRVDLQASYSYGLPGAPQVFIGGLAGSPFKKGPGGSISIIQTLLDFGRTQANVRARRAEVAANQEALRADRNRVALEVQQAYLQALQSQRLLAVNRRILDERRLVARQAETLRENGLASRVDVDLAEVAVSQAQLAVVRTENEIATAFAALTTAIGRPVAPDSVLTDVVPAGAAAEPGPLPSLETEVQAALRERPELRQLAAQVRVSESQVEAARAQKRPQLNALGSVGKVNPSPLIEDSDEPYAVAVVLTFPLFTGGLVEGQVEEARRNAAGARANREELANQVRQQVVTTVANLTAAEEGLRVARVQLARAEDAQSLATQRYQAQLGSIVELTQAQVAYATAQNDLLRALYERELARAALSFATGRGFIAKTPPPAPPLKGEG